MVTFRPTKYPPSFRPVRNAGGVRSTFGAFDALLRKPITGTNGCCARTTTGHAAALPSPAMNSLRSISDLLRLDRQPIAVGAVCLALTRSFLQRGRLLVAHCRPAR